MVRRSSLAEAMVVVLVVLVVEDRKKSHVDECVWLQKQKRKMM